MKLPRPAELKDSDAKYLYLHDIKEFFGRKSWERYVYMNRLCTVIDFIKRNIEDSAIVDVGCAQGNFSLALAKIGYETYGVDLRSSFITYAKLKMSEDEKKVFHVGWMVADARNLPLQSNSVGCVLLLEILEHTIMPEKMIEEACRVLKRGGYLIVSTPNQKRMRMSAKIISYSDFFKKKYVIKNIQTLPDSTAKGSEHIFEFQMMELLKLLRKFNLKIVDIKWKTFLGFRFILAKLFDCNILSVLEKYFFKIYYLKEKFAMKFIFFCLKR